MKVCSVIAHESSDKQVHQPAATYELEGIELELRLKDGIVRSVDAPPAREPAIADVIATARDSVRETAAPSNPEE